MTDAFLTVIQIMPPLRAEASTVSLPPRERRVAKRRAKAIKLGLTPSGVLTGAAAKSGKQKANLPKPTLASTRARCQRELAFFNRADGIHVKQVVRRTATHAKVPRIPYLPGQEGKLTMQR
jgi:hypothetical protein